MQLSGSVRPAFVFALAVLMGGIAHQMENPESFSVWPPILLSASGGMFVYFGWEALSTMKADLRSRPGFLGSLSRTAIWTAIFAALTAFAFNQQIVPWALAIGSAAFLAGDYFFLRPQTREPRKNHRPPA